MQYVKYPYSYEELRRKCDSAFTIQQQWAPLIFDAYKYVSPGRNAISTMYGGNDTGLPWETFISNSVAATASKKRANQLVRLLLPPNQQWGYFEIDFDAIRKNTTIDFTPKDQQNALDSYYRFLNASNLAQHSNAAFQDCNISAGCLWINESDREPLIFESIPGFTVAPEFSVGSLIQDIWYKYRSSYMNLQLKYPTCDLSDFINQDSIDVYRGVVYDVATPGGGWSWRYLDLIFSDTKKQKSNSGFIVLRDEYYPEKRGIFFREEVRPSELVGRGPGIEYLPEIKRLIMLTYQYDEGAMIRNIPPIEVDPAMFKNKGKNNLTANYWPNGTFGKSVEFPEYSSPEKAIEYLTERVEEGFSVNPIGGLSLPKMSATEVSARLDASQQYSTIDASRFLKELCSPLFENTFKMLLKRNYIPKSAEIRYIMSTFPDALTFKYINPLGDIQKNNNMMRFTQTLQIAQQYLGPQSIYSILSLGDALEFFSENSGLPKSLFLDKQQMAQALSKVYQAASSAQSQNAIPSSQTVGALPNPITPQGYAI